MSTTSSNIPHILTKEDLHLFIAFKTNKTVDEWDVVKENILVYQARLYIFPRRWIAKKYPRMLRPDNIVSHIDLLFCSLPNPNPKPTPETILNLTEEAFEQQIQNEKNKQYTTTYEGNNLPFKYHNCKTEDIPYELYHKGILLDPVWKITKYRKVYEELKNTIEITHAYSSDWNESSAPHISGWCLDMWIPFPASLLTKNKSKIFKLLAHIRLRAEWPTPIPTIRRSGVDEDWMFEAMEDQELMKDLHEEIEMDDSRMYVIETLTVSHLKRKNEMDKNLPLDRRPFKERHAEYYESREKIKENLRRLN